MPEIGGGKFAGELKDALRAAVEKAKDQARARVGAAITELVVELRTGSEKVAKAIEADVLAARKEFSDLIGNAHDETEEVIASAKTAVEQTTTGEPHPPNGGGAG